MSYDYNCMSDGWISVAHGNDVFVAVNLLYNTSARSTDNGKTWTQQSMLN